MLRRFVLSAFLAAGFVGAAAAPALASASYCPWDPPVVVITPAGHAAVVFVTVSSSLTNVGEGLVSYKATRAYDASGNPYTAVAMDVWVPSNLLTGPFATTDTVSSGPIGTGTVYTTTNGTSGQTVHLNFALSTT